MNFENLGQNPTDELRLTASGATVVLTHPNYRGIVTWNFVGVNRYKTATLSVTASTSGEAFDIQVLDQDSATWNVRSTITATTDTTYSYQLRDTEVHVDGTVSIRYVDTTITVDETAAVLTIDAATLVNEPTVSDPGGASPLRLAVAYNAFSQVATFRDATNWSPIADPSAVCFTFMERGGAQACTTKGGSVDMPSEDSQWSIGVSHHTVRMAVSFITGTTLARTFAVDFDNFPRIVIYMGVGLLIVAVAATAYKHHNRKPRQVHIQPRK